MSEHVQSSRDCSGISEAKGLQLFIRACLRDYSSLTTLHQYIFIQTALLENLSVRADCCGLMEWPEELFAKPHLKELILSKNQLTGIPQRLSRLPALRVLRLDRCMIASVPTCIGQLTALVTLDLSCNQVRLISPVLEGYGRYPTDYEARPHEMSLS